MAERETIYLYRNNTFAKQFTENGTAVDLSSTTSIELVIGNLEDTTATIFSITNQGSGSTVFGSSQWGTGIITFAPKVDTFATSLESSLIDSGEREGIRSAWFVTKSSTQTAGIIWPPFTIEFRKYD